MLNKRVFILESFLFTPFEVKFRGIFTHYSELRVSIKKHHFNPEEFRMSSISNLSFIYLSVSLRGKISDILIKMIVCKLSRCEPRLDILVLPLLLSFPSIIFIFISLLNIKFMNHSKNGEVIQRVPLTSHFQIFLRK